MPGRRGPEAQRDLGPRCQLWGSGLALMPARVREGSVTAVALGGSRGSEQRVVGARRRRRRRGTAGCKVTAVPGEAALEVPDAHGQAVSGEGLAIGRGIEGGEVRIERDE